MPYLCKVKKAFATFFLLLIMGASMHQLALAAMYVLNQDYIAATFCVNKEKVEMKCNGKCHLSKSISKATESSENKDKASVEIQLLLPVFLPENNIELPQLSAFSTAITIQVLALKDTYSYTVLDPPRQSV